MIALLAELWKAWDHRPSDPNTVRRLQDELLLVAEEHKCPANELWRGIVHYRRQGLDPETAIQTALSSLR